MRCPISTIAKTIVPSLASSEPCNAHRLGSKSFFAGEALTAGDMVYLKGSDGLVYKANGTAATAPALADGMVLSDTAIGIAVTIFDQVDVSYGPGTLTPGQRLYVSATAGALDTAATTGGLTPVAKVLYNNPNAAVPHAVIRLLPLAV